MPTLLLAWCLAILLAGPLVMLIHELGHAVAALALTHGPVVVQTGRRAFVSPRIGRLTLAIGPGGPAGGRLLAPRAGVAPRGGRDRRGGPAREPGDGRDSRDRVPPPGAAARRRTGAGGGRRPRRARRAGEPLAGAAPGPQDRHRSPAGERRTDRRAVPRARVRRLASVPGVSAPPAPRKHQTRSRMNPGGMDVLTVLGTDVLPVHHRKPSWFKVPMPGGPRLPRAVPPHRGGGPHHGVQGGRLPQHRGLLGARHRDVHDPRRHVHAPLRLLPRADRQADAQRPARAGARRALASPAWACATR